MAVLRDFEKRLEGAVEGFFARAFRSGLQPVEMAKAVQRYAANYQQVGVDAVFVPNVYRFELSTEDHERFAGFEDSLRRELAQVVRRTARERGWRLHGPVRIEILPADHVRVGTYELRGKAEAATPATDEQAPVADAPFRPVATSEPRVTVADEAESRTRVLPVASQSAALIVLGSNRRHQVDGQATIGRLPECDVTLADASVSRRHARVTRLGDRWTIEDLGSTNGIKVNGARVASADLHDGDRVELGTVKLAFSTQG